MVFFVRHLCLSRLSRILLHGRGMILRMLIFGDNNRRSDVLKLSGGAGGRGGRSTRVSEGRAEGID